MLCVFTAKRAPSGIHLGANWQSWLMLLLLLRNKSSSSFAGSSMCSCWWCFQPLRFVALYARQSLCLTVPVPMSETWFDSKPPPLVELTCLWVCRDLLLDYVDPLLLHRLLMHLPCHTVCPYLWIVSVETPKSVSRPAHISSQVVRSRPHTSESVSRHDPPILLNIILHSLMDVVAAAQLIFPVVCTDASLLSNCSAHVTEMWLCCSAFASLDQKSQVASSHFHSSISSIVQQKSRITTSLRSGWTLPAWLF